MSTRWVLVDGYSVMHAWPQLRQRAGHSLERRRDLLVRVLRQYADQTGHRVTVVFDGYAAKRKPATNAPTPGVEVLFSDTGKTADDVIERVVSRVKTPEMFLVVTSDNMVRQTVESSGAQSVAAEVFEAEVHAALVELAGAVAARGRRRPLGGLRDRLPD